MRSAAEYLAVALLAGCAAAPQDKPPPEQEPEPKWELSGYLMQFSVPGQSDFLAPVITADRGSLHLEARYNYEGHETASAWVGHNFAWDGDVALTVTPMAGLVFGDNWGIAPGLRAELTWKQFDAATEAEYMIDFEDEDDSFFYSWTEVGWSPSDWLRLGVVGQRTRVRRTDHEVDRGLLLQLSHGALSVTVYTFEPWDNDRYWAFTVGTSF